MAFRENFGVLRRGIKLLNSGARRVTEPMILTARSVVTKPSGAVLPEPSKVPFGLLGIIGAVIPGLLIGATISKNIANFLEENDLFVPADDDDDDD